MMSLVLIVDNIYSRIKVVE